MKFLTPRALELMALSCIVLLTQQISVYAQSNPSQAPIQAPSLDMGTLGLILFTVTIVIILALVVRMARVVRQTERGLIERYGKYRRFASPGLIFLLPIVDRVVRVNVTERMSPVAPQEVITKDKVVMKVDAVVFFKVKSDEDSVKASEYNVNNFEGQIEVLARTTLRNIIGNLEMAEANAQRDKINTELTAALGSQSLGWGVDILRAELKDLVPPPQIQESMNTVIVANNQKLAAIDQANAVATQADGQRRATIAQAEGERQASILRAEGQQQATVLIAGGDAQATKLRNEALTSYFKDSAVTFKQLDTVANALQNNSKIIVPEGNVLTLILNEAENIGHRILPVQSPQPEQSARPTKTDKPGMANK